jgi:hypothetical protein
VGYEKQLQDKERKDRLRTFTDKKLNRRQRKMNRALIEKIQKDLPVDNDKMRAERIERLKTREEKRFERVRQSEEAKKKEILASIKKLEEKHRTEYKLKHPKIPAEVKELR